MLLFSSAVFIQPIAHPDPGSTLASMGNPTSTGQGRPGPCCLFRHQLADRALPAAFYYLTENRSPSASSTINGASRPIGEIVNRIVLFMGIIHRLYCWVCRRFGPSRSSRSSRLRLGYFRVISAPVSHVLSRTCLLGIRRPGQPPTKSLKRTIGLGGPCLWSRASFWTSGHHFPGVFANRHHDCGVLFGDSDDSPESLFVSYLSTASARTRRDILPFAAFIQE